MPLTLFARRFTLLAAVASCLYLALNPCPLQAAPARDWPQYGRADVREQREVSQTVRAAQFLLRARGYPVAADGIFGKSTDAAIRRFQRSRHLIADGTLRPPTWEALAVRVVPGASGPAVSAAQVQLRAAGYAVPVDGRFGPQTKAALLKFQTRTGHSADGIIGLNTWAELMMVDNYGD